MTRLLYKYILNKCGLKLWWLINSEYLCHPPREFLDKNQKFRDIVWLRHQSRCEEQGIFLFHKNVQTVSRTHLAAYYVMLSQRQGDQGPKLTNDFPLGPSWRMNGAVLLLPLYAIMAWTGTLPFTFLLHWTHGGAVGRGTALLAGSLRVRFFIDIILPAALCPWGRLSL